MKQHQINKAYAAISRLMNLQMPVRDAYNLYMLAEKIRPVYNFELEQEKKLLEKYEGAYDESAGVFTFKDKDTTEAFRSEMFELNNMDVGDDIEPVHIYMDAMGDQRITPTDIMCLDGFVVFE